MSSTASNGAARQSPDEHLHSASRGGGQIKSNRGGLPAGLVVWSVRRPNCGSGLAREGGLPANQFLEDVPSPTVGASLLAKAACQPTNSSQMYPAQLCERACSRRRPASQPIPHRCTQPNCGSGLAREDGPPANQFLTDVPSPIVGAGLLAKTARQPTNSSQMYPAQLWERACSRRRPTSQPIPCRCPQPNCRSEPVRDDGLTVNAVYRPSHSFRPFPQDFQVARRKHDL
ncbi:hypothetical protein PS647_02135 [Pseudomonas fluorescens]|nr:hypothetical protein PS647_02135 [Pseudomonas fluorescens]